MRRFRFRLEKVLRHRETIEMLREQDFGAAQSRLNEVETRIAEMHREFERIVSGRPGCMPGERFDPGVIQDRERYLRALLSAVEVEERRAAACRVVADEMRRALVAARQAREVVSRLKERHLAEYAHASLKVEQDALDEIATLGHARRMKEAV